MAGTVGEGTTQGLDDLNARCAQYKKVCCIVFCASSKLTTSWFFLLISLLFLGWCAVCQMALCS